MARLTESTWLSPPADLILMRDHVDIWRILLDTQLDRAEHAGYTLSADEIERASRFHFERDRQRFILAHAALRDILSRYLQCNPHEVRFAANDFGKPSLTPPAKLEFNLSHSNEFALVAVTRERKIGVDVEVVRDDIELESLASRYFSPGEFSELTTLPTEKKLAGFFACWTRKEAYIKAQGKGLSFPLDSFDVSLSPNELAELRATRPDPREAVRWTLRGVDVFPRYAGALAVEGRALDFRFWEWKAIQ